MFLIWGTKKTERKLGFVAEYCPSCQQIQRFKVARVGMAGHFFFVPLSKGTSLGYVGECQQCNGRFSVTPFNYRTFEKAKITDIDALIKTTNPALTANDPREIAASNRQRQIFDPLLRFSQSLTDRELSGAPLDWKGAVAFLASIGVPLFLGMYVSDLSISNQLKDALVVVCIGLAVAGIIASIVYISFEPRRFYARQIHPAVVKALAPLKVGKGELEACFASLRKYNYRIADRVSPELLMADLAKEAPGTSPPAQQRAMLSIDSLAFDTTGLELAKQVDGENFWIDAQGGEIVSLAFFKPHDFEWDALSPDLHRRYQDINQSTGGALIDCQVKKSAGLEGIRVVSKSWAKSEGLAKAYSASLSVILEDCCYILKVMSQERGTTGVREAMVDMLQIQRGELPLAGNISQQELADVKTVRSMDEFLAASREGPMQRIEADNANYDEAFADHPLSRVRAILDRLAASFRPAPELAQAKPFRLSRESQTH